MKTNIDNGKTETIVTIKNTTKIETSTDIKTITQTGNYIKTNMNTYTNVI